MEIRIKTDLDAEPVSIDDMKQYLKFEEDATSEVNLIKEMISSVRTLMERRTGLAFAEKTYQFRFKGEERPFILPRIPVISIESVKTIDYQGEETALTLNSGYYKKGKYEVEIIVAELFSQNAFVEAKSLTGYQVEVEAKVGYGHDDTETLPFDLKEAIQRQVFQWYENRDDFYEKKLLGVVKSVINSYVKTFV